jgi:hypothetical protein
METETYTCSCTQVARPVPPSVYCDTTIGKDTSGSFTLSYKGVAVRTDCNRYVTFRREKDQVRLYDVTGLTLPGCDALIYRVPVTEQHVRPGDLLVISDCPLQILFVTEIIGERVRGYNSSGEEITFIAPKRLGDCARYIRIVSVLDTCGAQPGDLEEDDIALIAALLCCKPCGTGYSADVLSSTLAQNLLPGLKARQLPLLLALRQGDCLESFILTRALQGRLDAACKEPPILTAAYSAPVPHAPPVHEAEPVRKPK